jgi:hypothetical protein
MKTNAELLELCEKAKQDGTKWPKCCYASFNEYLLNEVAQEALPRLIAENDEWREMARADLQTLGVHPDYALAADMLRASEVTKRTDLEDLAYALGHPEAGYTSRGDWEGFRKHWLTAALKEQTP